jgi:spore coat polysaccharide biosynthesis predicted glycosyltransferase SpsG/CMP-N-acetylneuraminic acid synthetase
LHDVWALVPARGGSQAIPRKNLRPLGGRPLVRHVLSTLAAGLGSERVVLSTDDPEIARQAEGLARTHPRPPELATDEANLDEVATAVAAWLIDDGASPNDLLLTVQPTSPFLKFETVVAAADLLRANHGSVLTVSDDRHLRWTRDAAGVPQPLFEERRNRQWLPSTLAETGGLIGSSLGQILETGTRVNAPVALLEVELPEGLDIDTFADWAAAEHYVNRRRIVIRADSAPPIGMGHVHRASALAIEMAEHDVTIVSRRDGPFALGAKFLGALPNALQLVESEKEFLAFLAQAQPDITFLDILDTDVAAVDAVKAHSRFVVSLEDLGTGAERADLVINDLYTERVPQANHWYGVEHAVLAPHFEDVSPHPFNESVSRVIVAFGGTDEHNLTAKALRALGRVGFSGQVVAVLGPGYLHDIPDLETHRLHGEVHRAVHDMAVLMRGADLAITSAGRTVTELMTLGVPTIALCQNARELRHTHASVPYGVLNLGLGDDVDEESLARHITTLIGDPELRCYLRERALHATHDRSNRKLVSRVLAAAAEHRASKEFRHSE